MDLDVSTHCSSEDEFTPKSRRLRARKAASSSSTDAPLPKKKKVDQSENLSVEEIYKQLNSVKAKCTSLETIYEFPKNSKDPAKSLMSSMKSRRSCLLSDFYNPTKSKVKARKERAKRLRKRGVKVPTGNGVTLEQLQAALGAISEDEENEHVPNSPMMGNLTVNTGINTFTPKKVVLRPNRDRQDVSLVEGPYILPDLSYQDDAPPLPPMSEEELYEKTKFIFEDPSDGSAKPAKRKGRRSGCGRDLLPPSVLSSQSKHLSLTAAVTKELDGEKEVPEIVPRGNHLASLGEGREDSGSSSSKSTDLVCKDFVEKFSCVHPEAPSHQDHVLPGSCNLNSGSGVLDNNKISSDNEIYPLVKERSNIIPDSCSVDVNKRRSKRRVSGVEKTLYSFYSTHSPTCISEAVEEESNSSKLDESSNDSLRTGFETKLDLNGSLIDDDLISCDGKRSTLKRKSESDSMSPLAACLQTLAVKDTCGDVARGVPGFEGTTSCDTGGENDFSADVPQRKIIHRRKRSTRLPIATVKPPVACDLNRTGDHPRAEHKAHHPDDAFINSLIDEEVKSVTKTLEPVPSEALTSSCKSKPKVTSSKPRKQSRRRGTGKKRLSVDKLGKSKSLSWKGQGSDPLPEPIVCGLGQHSTSNTFDVKSIPGKSNSKVVLKETSRENVGVILNCHQEPNSRESHLPSDFDSKQKYTGTLKALTRGAKLLKVANPKVVLHDLKEASFELPIPSTNSHSVHTSPVLVSEAELRHCDAIPEHSDLSTAHTKCPVALKVPTPAASPCSAAPHETPRSGSSAPRSGSSAPRPDSSAPRSGSSAPRSDSSAPRSGSSAPRSDSSAPRSDSSAPRSGSSAPRSGSSAPCSGSSAPRSDSSAPRPGSSAPHLSSVIELNADSPILSAMFNNAVSIRVGKVFSNNKLHKSDKMASRKIVDEFKVYQS